jgi:hypothetical protein
MDASRSTNESRPARDLEEAVAEGETRVRCRIELSRPVPAEEIPRM